MKNWLSRWFVRTVGWVEQSDTHHYLYDRKLSLGIALLHPTYKNFRFMGRIRETSMTGIIIQDLPCSPG
ncbi:MAG: hypothetical protein PHP70_12380 [Gallionella sp.]|nr:hypothetical protein [Gallionella sp.]